MSLLNEALRKNRTVNRSTVSPNFTAKRHPYSKRTLLLAFFAVIAAAAIFFILIWTHQSNNLRGSSSLRSSVHESAVNPTSTDNDRGISLTKDTAANDGEILGVKTEVHSTVVLNKSADISSHAAVPKAPIPDTATDKKTVSAEKPAVKVEPIVANTDIFFQKALQLHRDGRIEEAIGIYKEILNREPDHYDTFCNLSSAYIERSDFSSAYDLLNRYPASEPIDPNILLNLAISEIGLGKNMAAIDHLNEIDTADKDLNFKKYFHLEVAAARIGNTEEALIHYKDAEKIKNNYPNLLYNTAILYDKLGRYDEAVNYYLRYLGDPSLPSDETSEVKGRIQILQAYISGAKLNAVR